MTRLAILLMASVSALFAIPSTSASAAPQRLVAMQSVVNQCNVRLAASVSMDPIRCNNTWNIHENEFLLTDLGSGSWSIYSVLDGQYVGLNPDCRCLQSRYSAVRIYQKFGFVQTTYNGRTAWYMFTRANVMGPDILRLVNTGTGSPVRLGDEAEGPNNFFYLKDIAG